MMNKILSRDIADLNTRFDFTEGILSGFSWDVPKNDFLLSVLYNWEEPQEFKDQEITLRFVHCERVDIDLQKIIENTNRFSLNTPWQEVTSIDLGKENGKVQVTVFSNIVDGLIKILCGDVWIETAEGKGCAHD